MIIVITGASSGLGKLLAEKYRKLGHKVVGLSRHPECEDDIKCDVSNLDETQYAFSLIKEKYGKIDMLFNNAGYGVSGATELISNDSAKQIFDVNFFGVLNCSKCALPLMGKGSRIINISSACALFALPFRSLYCASKASVNLLSMSMRMELIPAGIDITCICPGDTKTNFTKNREKHFVTNERYGSRIENATLRVDKNENKRMPAEKVVKKIIKIACKKKTKPMYIIGAKYKLLAFAMRFFPQSALNKMTYKIYGGNK